MLGWIDFLACRGHDHDRLGFDPGLGFHWFLTLLESAVETSVVHIGNNCDSRIEGFVVRLN